MKYECDICKKVFDQKDLICLPSTERNRFGSMYLCNDCYIQLKEEERIKEEEARIEEQQEVNESDFGILARVIIAMGMILLLSVLFIMLVYNVG